MKKFLLSALAIASIGTGCAVLAQTVEGLDLDAIRARSAKSEQDATALVNEVERRGDAFRKDAQTVQAVALSFRSLIIVRQPGVGLPVRPQRARSASLEVCMKGFGV